MSSEHKGRGKINDTLNEHRRRFLQGVGATGVAGITAGCIGDGDDDPNGEDDDTEPTPTEDAEFQISDLAPGETSVTVGETVEVSATITNAGEEEDTQAIALTVDGDEHDSVEVTLGEGEDESVTFDEIETADLSPDDYEYEVSSDDDSASATLTVEGVDLVSLFSFDADEITVLPGANTVSGTVENTLDVGVESGELSGSLPDGWELESESGTSFDLASGDSQEVEWEISIPGDAEGEYELSVEESYSAAGSDDSFTTSIDVVVVEPLGAPWGLNSGNEDGDFDPVEVDDLVFDDEIPDSVTVLGGLNSAARDPADVENTDHDDIYLTEHWGGDLGYDVPVGEGVYDVTLHFAETWFGEDGGSGEGGDGSRVFDVSINGEEVLSEFDPHAEAGGAYIAAPQTFTVAATDGWITIESETHEDNTLFNGVEIRPAEDLAAAPFGIDSGGEDVDESVEIDGLEFTNVEESDVVTAYGNPDASATGTAVGTFTSDEPVEGTDHDLLYQTEHHGGDLSYDVFIENGVYEVTLHFAETNDALTGDARLFNVSVQDDEVLSEYAIAAEVGINVATTEVAVPVEVTNNVLTVASETLDDNSKFSGIEIREFDGEVPDDAVGHWSFDTDGVDDDTVIDQTGNGHDGTIQGGVSPGVTSPTGAGATFDGEEGSTVMIPDDDEIDPSEFTVSVWARTDESGFWSALVGKDGSYWCGTLDDTAIPRLDAHDDTGVDGDITAETAIDDGEWHHVVYRHGPSEDESTVHVDGELEGRIEDVTESEPSDMDLAIGSKSDVADWFEGDLSEIRLYDRPLGDGEIASLYMEGEGPDAITAPYGFSAGGYPDDHDVDANSDVPVVIDGLEFPGEADASDIEHVHVTHDEDHWFNDEDWFSPPAGSAGTDAEIGETEYDALYQTEFWGPDVSFDFTIEDGVYDVTLHFSEQTQDAEGDRVFDVAVQGEEVLSEFDIYAEAGGMNTAVTHTVEEVEVTDGSLQIDTTTHEDATSISGIEIREADDVDPDPSIHFPTYDFLDLDELFEDDDEIDDIEELLELLDRLDIDLVELLEELDVEDEFIEMLLDMDFEELLSDFADGDVDSVEPYLVAIEELLVEFDTELEPVIADLAAAIEELGLDMRAVYVSMDALDADLDAIVELLVEFGQPMIVEAFESPEVWSDPDSIAQFAEDLSELEAELAELGLEFGYYLSDDSFEEIDGTAGYELLVDHLEGDVKLQLDVAAALEGDLDVIALIEELDELGGQLDALDMSGLSADTDDAEIVAAAKDAGAEHIVYGYDDVEKLE
ncbi:malectin domain-containing carbohydrate-binding protein [Halobacteria archaeon AArc-dxtr1]|nr:malectin domain-containing carbohydrate-binding protein [Halobacteria archaeon AArc-dxtr1]